MNNNAVRFAAGFAVFAAGAPFPASAQFFYPPIVIVPPPAQSYATPKSGSKSAPDKAKPADTAAQPKSGGHYEGRTYVPD